MLKITQNKFLIYVMMLFLTSCLSRFDKHGYMFELSDYNLIEIDTTTKNNTLEMMGFPTITENIDDEEIWIYYAEERKNLLFFKPKIISRNIFLIRFDNKGIARNIENYDLSNESKNNKFSSHYTKVKSRKLGFFSSIFNNIGQIKAQ